MSIPFTQKGKKGRVRPEELKAKAFSAVLSRLIFIYYLHNLFIKFV